MRKSGSVTDRAAGSRKPEGGASAYEVADTRHLPCGSTIGTTVSMAEDLFSKTVSRDGGHSVKRGALLQHLRRHGCVLKREGAGHSLWTNSSTGATEAVPRHTEVANKLARTICPRLGLPELGTNR